MGYRDHVTEADMMLFGGTSPKGTGHKKSIIPYFRNDDASEIDQIVAQLSADTRTILFARYVNNLPIEEIAEEVGISRATIFRRFAAIRETILAYLR